MGVDSVVLTTMRCPNCKTQEMGRDRGEYQYRESGLNNVWLVDWPMYICPQCGLMLAIFPNLEFLTRYIAKELVRGRGRLNGNPVRFLRKAMGLRTAELAEIIGVDRVTVSRWENDKVVIDPYKDFKLRMAAVDRILTPHERRSAREGVGLMFQHTYDPDTSVSDVSIRVPANPVATGSSESAAEVFTA
jgi:putative zinc finger/helix-turn-helix YgiT family protein